MMKKLGQVSGLPDLILIREHHPACQVYALELKAVRGGRLSEAQRECHRMLERAGAIVGVAYGLDEALDWLQSHKLLRGVTQ
jgi:hypothetical protein